jgi:hypothetical protein
MLLPFPEFFFPDSRNGLASGSLALIDFRDAEIGKVRFTRPILTDAKPGLVSDLIIEIAERNPRQTSAWACSHSIIFAGRGPFHSPVRFISFSLEHHILWICPLQLMNPHILWFCGASVRISLGFRIFRV